MLAGVLQGIPVRVREALYLGYAVGVFVLGAIQVGYVTGSGGQPEWLTVALAVAAYVGAALGVTAASNTPRRVEGRHRADEGGRVDLAAILGIILLVLVLILWETANGRGLG